MITTINQFKLINEDRSFKVVAKDRKHLDMLIKKNMEKFGVNCDLNYIDVSQIDDLENIFYLNNYFTGDISNWDVSNVKKMDFMFEASRFNGDISKWNVSNVESMIGMFQSSKFDGDISNWDVSKVTHMYSIFDGAPIENDPPDWYLKYLNNRI